MTNQPQLATHTEAHGPTMSQPPFSRYDLRSAPSRKRSNQTLAISTIPTDTSSSTTSDTISDMNDTNSIGSSPMKRQRHQMNDHARLQPEASSMMTDSTINEPIEMKQMSEADEMSDATTTSTASVSTCSHILYLDQTALRVCASLLEQKEIISFGRSCHSTYETLNHPLTWAHTRPQSVGLDPLLPLPLGIHPFLQHLPVILTIRVGDTNISARLTHLVSELEPSPRYRLTGLTIHPTNNDGQNEVISQVVLQLLQNPHLVPHLSIIFLTNWCVWDGTEERRFFMPTHLLSAILQLPVLNRLHLQIRELTPELVNQFARVQLSLSQLEVCVSTRPGRESIIPLGNAPMCQGLVKLTLSGCTSSLNWNSDYLIGLTKLRTLHLICWFSYLQLIPTLSKMPSLRHLYITHMIEDEPNPRLFQFIDELDASVQQLDTISIQLITRSRGLQAPCRAADTPLLVELQQYIHQRHGPSQPLPSPHRLFVRLRKTEAFGCL